MSLPYDGYIWLVLTLGPLLVLQPRLQREVQVFFLILSRRKDISIILFSLLFLPGVLLHELSHFLMAKLLFIRTGRFSILPREMPYGQLQLGYVEIEKVDPIRETLVGVAPLLTGSAVVAYAGLVRLNLVAVYQALTSLESALILDSLVQMVSSPDFILWFYLVIAVSSTMFPSASDRRAWLPFLGIVLAGLTAAWFLGARDWLLPALWLGFNNAFRAMAVVFAITDVFHLGILAIVVLARRGLSSLTGLTVATRE